MGNILINTINSILNTIGTLITAILSILPDSPFSLIYNMNLDLSWFQYFNWIFPISEALLVMTSWLTCILLYYGLSIIMRWIKAIE